VPTRHNLTVDVYGRQSLGKDSSIDQQLDLGRRRADAEGWTVYDVYSDGVSASRHGRKTRTDWAKLHADVTSDRVDIIWLWESSRGDRRASTWLTLLEDCRAHRVRIYVETHGTLYDMANPRQWRSLAEDGTDNEYESEKISQRVARSMAARAADGKVHGRAPYGYLRRYELDAAGKRVLIGQDPDPVEAPIVREMYQRLARGDTLHALARDLETRGVRTRTGLVFSPQHIRDLVLRHTYAGIRAHTTGARPAHRPGATVETVRATWPALVPADLWHTVRNRLTAADRKTSRPGRANNPYSMIVRCHDCDGPMTVRYAGRVAQGGEYSCRDHSHVRVPKIALEAYLDKVICAYLARPDVIAELRRSRDGDVELQRVADLLAEARGELAELRAAVGAGRLTVASLIAAEPGHLTRIEQLEQRERELSAPPALAALITPGRDAKRRWKAAPVAAKREVARLLLAPGILGQVRVDRAPTPGHRGPVEDRVIWRRDDGDHDG
jgi:DNA invertase Pin-like site-specific DNA recombinase